MRTSRRGFSLVELLVVMAILLILAGLLSPAVQRMRESANQTSCANNLKQLGLAFHLYEQNHKTFPANRVPCGPTWAVTILPYVEQDALYVQWNPDLPYHEQSAVARQTSVASYFCPSRRNQHGLSITGDERANDDGLGIQVPGALADYAYNLGWLSGKDKDLEDYDPVFAIVPNLWDLTLDPAIKSVEFRELKINAQGITDVGVVIGQNPLPKTVVPKGTTVDVMFALLVPDLDDMKYKLADKRLKKKTLVIDPSGDLDYGVVVKQVPPKGTSVARNTQVEAFFAIRVPQLDGMKYKRAKKVLEDLTLVINPTGTPLNIAKGIVEKDGQEPPKKTIVPRGAIVKAPFVPLIDAGGGGKGGGTGGGGGGKKKEEPKFKNCSITSSKSVGQLPYDQLAFKPVQITDGLSNAILLGEKHVPLGHFGQGGWDSAAYNGRSFSSSGRGIGPGYSLAASLHDKAWRFGSYHPNVVQFLFADGSVHGVSIGMHPVLLGRLAHHSDGNTTPAVD